MLSSEQAQLRILNIVSSEPEISQRQLAERLGISLGKTNFLLKALFEKGLVKVDNFRRNGKKLAYLYLLTPEGAAAKLRLTRDYLVRKEAEYLALKSEIKNIRTELAEQEEQAWH